METNTITFKEHLPLEKYQQLIKFLDNIGVEILENDFYYELSPIDLKKLEKAEQQSKEGRTINMNDLLTKLKAKYGN
ncbi:toxin-antitoxin system, antitoxin component [Capnocytophaga bilenii]|jgi:hypothetical protein|uniref:toxin-antitoxin system, antitoxin component n=1 Tax=Capnocytophaga bilenii TaxID=2819369 RepID=UPI0028D1BC67|nr:toxin-antitoxin system, antitoxin component [Capnocytophaga bilenii]